jgi:hypothetical protein
MCQDAMAALQVCGWSSRWKDRTSSVLQSHHTSAVTFRPIPSPSQLLCRFAGRLDVVCINEVCGLRRGGTYQWYLALGLWASTPALPIGPPRPQHLELCIRPLPVPQVSATRSEIDRSPRAASLAFRRSCSASQPATQQAWQPACASSQQARPLPVASWNKCIVVKDAVSREWNATNRGSGKLSIAFKDVLGVATLGNCSSAGADVGLPERW